MNATCGSCDTVWDGSTKRAHCALCHHTFSTPGGFDKHRWAHARGHGCKHPSEVGLTERNGTWYISLEGDNPTHWR